MFLFQMVFANMRRRPLRAALTACGVALGIGAFVALVGFADAFEEQWRQFYRTKGTDLCVFRGNFMNKASTDESAGGKLRGIPVVADAAPVSFDLVDFTPDVSAVVQGWVDTSFEFESLTLVQGRRFQGDEPAILLGEILAGSIGKQAGDWVEVQGAPLRIVGVFRAQDTFSASTAVLPLHQLQRLSDLGTKVAGFHVRLRPSSPGVSPEDRLRRAKLAIESQLPGLKAMPAGIVAGDNHIVNFIRSTAWTTSLIALFIAVLGVANTMAMSVFERTREIGILRALGWSGSRIVRLILLEASVLGLAGGLMGLAAGQFGLWALASIRATAGLPRVYPSPVHFGEAMCIALAISLAAGFLPAYRGARFPPTTALRYE
jgi:putative ABC transport system permease protein